MRKILNVVLSLLFPITCLAQRNPFSSEQARFDAMTKRDTVALTALLSEDLSYMHSNGLEETKQDFIKSVVSKKIIYDSITIEKHHVKIYKKNAIITGVLTVKGQYKGTIFETRLRYLSFYIQKKKQWKLGAWQSLKL